MDHVLRKTVGPFAAGTRVKVIGENRDGTVTIEVIVPNPDDRHRSYDYEDMTFDIEADQVVKLRNRTDSVPATGREERRAFLNKLFAGTKPSREEA